MRVLHVIHTLDPTSGGPPQAVRQIARAASLQGQEHGVATLDAPGMPWHDDWPVAVHALGPAHTRWGWAPRLAPWLRREGLTWDLWLVHGLWQFHGLAVRAAARATGRPYAVVPHGMLDPWFGRHRPLRHLRKRLSWPLVERRVLRDAAAVLYTAEDEALRAPTAFGGWPAVRGAVVGLGLDARDVPAADAPDFVAAWPALRGRRLLLFLGRLHPKKGGDLLLRAFAAQRLAAQGFALVFAGPDEAGTAAAWRVLAQRLGIDGAVCFTGALHGVQKWAALRAAEAFVLPSHQENFGFAAAEALAAGTPVLLSQRVALWREAVAAGAGLAAGDDLAGTCELLQRWAAMDDHERLAMAQAAPRAFAAHFEIGPVAQRWVQALQTAAARGIDVKTA